MDKKIVMGVGALVVLAAGTMLMEKKGTHVQNKMVGKELLDAANLAKIDTILLKGDAKTLTLKNSNTGWKMVEDDNFPADATKVIKLLEDTAKIKYLRSVSQKKDAWAQFEVDGKKGLTLTGAGYKKELIVGKNRSGGGQYLRDAADDTTYLVDTAIRPDTDPGSWEYRTLTDLGENKIKKITFPKVGSEPPFTLTREAGDKPFALADLKDGETFKEKESDGVKNLLADLSYTKRVKRTPAYDAALAKAETVELSTLEGQEIKLKVVILDKEVPATDPKKEPEVEKVYYLHIESAASQLAQITELMKTWQFEISVYQANDFRRSRGDFAQKTES